VLIVRFVFISTIELTLLSETSAKIKEFSNREIKFHEIVKKHPSSRESFWQ